MIEDPNYSQKMTLAGTYYLIDVEADETIDDLK